ncbi:DcaP family trimeric outer membrane transporter [Stakelama sediminis]|uniref:Porin n=1 Tax=Stakelama sediminis TaxID=463200 RepID=A0A840Z1D6_9SPHN|nr:DcaP family trimeric outer membrane transporter [Stakelama sediminis]MBB5719502.1 hypothetical protein [Stakelama sediminis]
MAKLKRAALGLLLSASALAVPELAHAQSAREAELEQRLERLEAQMQQLRADLAAARQQQAQTDATAQAAVTKSDDTATKVAAIEAQPTQPQGDGFRVGDTTFKVGGFIRVVASNSHFGDGEVPNNTVGRDFDLAQAVPVGGGAPSNVQDFTAKQSRAWISMSTSVGSHVVKGLIEADFQTLTGSQRTTNRYDFSLRRAFLQFDNWLIGQEWTTFQNVAVLPESTDFVGVAGGTIFVRQPMVRYTAALGQGMTLAVAAENPESGTATLGSPALTENGDDHIPDFTARLNVAGKSGEFALAGIARQISVNAGGDGVNQFGWGISGSGKLFLNAAHSADLRFMATYGSDIGRYVGFNFAPDAIYDPATDTLSRVKVFGGFAALRVPVAANVRVNLMGDYQNVDYADDLTIASIGGYNHRTYSGAVNLFYSPFKSVDLGVEYRHRVRTIVTGATGTLDRISVAGKYTF